MKNILALIFFLFIALNVNANLSKKINIESDLVEYEKVSNLISFTDNVKIVSENINITAKKAIYDNKTEIISVVGSPSIITSGKKNIFFKGEAEKIVVYSDEKIHLIGNATMNYENINITSNKIVFNPQTGNLSSQQ